MNKTNRNILIVIVIALLVFGIALALYSHFKSEPMDANVQKDNILDDANAGLENLINDILGEENEENTENKEEKTENTTNNTENSNTQSQNSEVQKDNNVGQSQTTPGEKKAIDLAKETWKKEWGNLSGVSFNNVMIQGDGKYVVSVNDSKTTKVICRYVIDTATGVVEEQN